MATGASQSTSRITGSLDDPRTPGGSRIVVLSELALAVSGIALSFFMMGHLTLLFTVVIAADTMDELAEFLERYYLLQASIAPIIFLLAFHIVLASRRIPATFARQSVLMRHMRSIKHVDTWTWAVQVATGMAIVILASIHMWIVLTDLPIESGKSAARVIGSYLWVYIPFVAIVESHISFGIFRILVKWGFISRGRAHILLIAWSIAVFSVGYLILATFYRLGGEA